MRDPFEVYYSIADLCARLGFSDTFVRRQLKAGAFCPEGVDGRPDFGKSGILEIGGELRVPWRAVELFLARHEFVRTPEIVAANRARMAAQLRVLPAARGALAAGVCARNEGELRRKIVQMSGRAS